MKTFIENRLDDLSSNCGDIQGMDGKYLSTKVDRIIELYNNTKTSIKDALKNLSSNCGDIRGMDGEYLSDEVDNIIELYNTLTINPEMGQ